MKKFLIFCGLLLISSLVIDQINLFDHILAFLFIGLIPYTNISIPPLAMFFAWLSLPLIILGFVTLFKGLFLLSLIIAEKADRGLVAYQLSRTESDKPNRTLKHIKSLKKVFKQRLTSMANLPKRRVGKLSSDTN